jgi:hypothetical protein
LKLRVNEEDSLPSLFSQEKSIGATLPRYYLHYIDSVNDAHMKYQDVEIVMILGT